MSHARNTVRRILNEAAAIPEVMASGSLATAAALLLEADGVDDDNLRVGLVGEFNAGKSSLVNAIAGREVAAADALEMTAWIASYRRASQDEATLLLAGGKVVETSLAAFVAETQARRWTQDETNHTKEVLVGLSDFPAGITLIDLPGLGAARANEKRLRDALGLVDVILWLTDVESIGEVLSLELIRKLRHYGAPVRVVITKVDLLDEPTQQLPDLAAFVSNAIGIDSNEVLAVTARPSGRADMRPYEVAQLTDALQRMAPKARIIREKAANALTAAAAQEIAAGFRSERAARATALDRFNADLERLNDVAELIHVELRDAARHQIADALVTDVNRTIEMVTDAICDNSNPPSIERLIGYDPLGPEHLDRVARQVSGRLSRRELELWEHYANRVELGPRMTLAVGVPYGVHGGGLALRGIESPLTAVTEGERQQQLLAENRAALRGIFATAAGATVWAAALPSISAAAALTGIGLPIFGIGVLFSSLASSVGRRDEDPSTSALNALDRRRVARARAEDWLRNATRQASLALLNDKLAADISSQLRERARRIAVGLHGGIDETELRSEVARLDAALRELDAIAEAPALRLK
jgi:small GTP-binding protein